MLAFSPSPTRATTGHISRQHALLSKRWLMPQGHAVRARSHLTYQSRRLGRPTLLRDASSTHHRAEAGFEDRLSRTRGQGCSHDINLSPALTHTARGPSSLANYLPTYLLMCFVEEFGLRQDTLGAPRTIAPGPGHNVTAGHQEKDRGQMCTRGRVRLLSVPTTRA